MKSYSLSRDVETIEYTGYKYIHYGDIHKKVADVIDESSNLPNIKAGSYELLEQGDLVLADASEDYQGIAAPAVITIDTPYKLVSGLHTIALRPKQVDSLFLYYLINSPSFRRYGYRTGTGMKVFGISAANVLKYEGIFPSLKEQTQIGKAFKQLDDAINLNQQKLLKLEEMKRAYLEQILNQKIHFSGFSGEWEQRKLDSIYKKIRNAFVGTATPYYAESGNFYLESNNVKDGQINRITEVFINDEFYEKQKDKWLHTGDLVMVQSGHVGHTAVIGEELDSTAAHALIMFQEYKEQVDPYFLNFQFQTREAKRKLGIITTGNTIKHILASEMKKFEVNIPRIEEQNQISTFFKTLDYTITLHQAKVDKLKQIKIGFSQKMFI